MADLNFQVEFEPVFNESAAPAVLPLDIDPAIPAALPFDVDTNASLVEVIPLLNPQEITKRGMDRFLRDSYSVLGAVSLAEAGFSAFRTVEKYDNERLKAGAYLILYSVGIIMSAISYKVASESSKSFNELDKRIKASYDPDTFWLK